MQRTIRAKSPLTRKQHGGLIAIYIVTSIALIFYDHRGYLAPLQGVSDSPLRTISIALITLSDASANMKDRFAGATELRDENTRLRAEHDRLIASESRVTELELQNEQLRDLPAVAQRYPQYPLVPAAVINRDPKSPEQAVTINRGSADGLTVGMPVISGSTLVGLITQVAEQSAKVTFTTDQHLQLSIELRDIPGSQGIAYGQWQQGGRMQLRYINRNVTIPEHAVVVTSTLTLGVPQGLLVGVTTGSSLDEQHDSLIVSVLPLVKFDSLEYVTVLRTDAH